MKIVSILKKNKLVFLVLVEVTAKVVLSCPFGSVAEHSLGKGEVPGPIPGMGTKVSGASA